MAQDRSEEMIVKAIMGDHPYQLNRRDLKAIAAYRKKYGLADDEVIFDGRVIKVPTITYDDRTLA